jgi:hypothetical protein
MSYSIFKARGGLDQAMVDRIRAADADLVAVAAFDPKRTFAGYAPACRSGGKKCGSFVDGATET